MDRVANLVGLSKSGRTINVFFFLKFSYKEFRLQEMATVSDGRGVNSTPYRARVTDANIFSRVAQACELRLFACFLKTVIFTNACHVSHLA